eukprot:m.108002 g.108002  ORF g.108002 m.108002 type:complete len:345 (-) comp15858_c0_seq1:127-1161(-)
MSALQRRLVQSQMLLRPVVLLADVADKVQEGTHLGQLVVGVGGGVRVGHGDAAFYRLESVAGHHLPAEIGAVALVGVEHLRAAVDVVQAGVEDDGQVAVDVLVGEDKIELIARGVNVGLHTQPLDDLLVKVELQDVLEALLLAQTAPAHWSAEWVIRTRKCALPLGLRPELIPRRLLGIVVLWRCCCSFAFLCLCSSGFALLLRFQQLVFEREEGMPSLVNQARVLVLRASSVAFVLCRLAFHIFDSTALRNDAALLLVVPPVFLPRVPCFLRRSRTARARSHHCTLLAGVSEPFRGTEEDEHPRTTHTSTAALTGAAAAPNCAHMQHTSSTSSCQKDIFASLQ